MRFKAMDFLDKKMNGMNTLLQYKVTPLLVNEAKENAYWKDRSGNARRGINGGAEATDHKFTLYLAYSEEYGKWLEEGTGIYGPMHRAIVPIDKKVLSWVDEDGKRYFAKSVKGIKPMPVLHDTLEKNKGNITNKIVQYWGE